MNCRELVEFLLDYEEGRLPAEVEATFEAHVGKCPPCRDYLLSYRSAVTVTKECLCKEAPCDDMPEPLVQAILAARRAGS